MRTVTPPLNWNRILNPIPSRIEVVCPQQSVLSFKTQLEHRSPSERLQQKNEVKVSVFDLLDDTKCDAH